VWRVACGVWRVACGDVADMPPPVPAPTYWYMHARTTQALIVSLAPGRGRKPASYTSLAIPV